MGWLLTPGAMACASRGIGSRLFPKPDFRRWVGVVFRMLNGTALLNKDVEAL